MALTVNNPNDFQIEMLRLWNQNKVQVQMDLAGIHKSLDWNRSPGPVTFFRADSQSSFSPPFAACGRVGVRWSHIISFVPVRIHELTAAHGSNHKVPDLPQPEALPGSECDVTPITGDGVLWSQIIAGLVCGALQRPLQMNAIISSKNKHLNSFINAALFKAAENRNGEGGKGAWIKPTFERCCNDEHNVAGSDADMMLACRMGAEIKHRLPRKNEFALFCQQRVHRCSFWFTPVHCPIMGSLASAMWKWRNTTPRPQRQPRHEPKVNICSFQQLLGGFASAFFHIESSATRDVPC